MAFTEERSLRQDKRDTGGGLMVEVYYYMPANEVDNAVECGIKLSRWYDREVMIEGDVKKCMTALLNPKDDIAKYRSGELKCLKFELSPSHCYVADGSLYRVGLKSQRVMAAYLESVIPVEKYIFGSYRVPECLITSTVIAGQASVLDKRLDSPVLFDSSEELYVNNIVEAYREKHEDFTDTLLYYFFCTLTQTKGYIRIEDSENNIAVFLDEKNGRAFTVRIPDIGRY